MERESRFDSLKRQRRSPGPGFGSAVPREICQPVELPPTSQRPASSSAPPPSDGHHSGAGMTQSMTTPGEGGASGAALLSKMASCMTGSVGPALYCSGSSMPLTRSITTGSGGGQESDDELLVPKRRALSAAGSGRRPLSRPPSEQRGSGGDGVSGSGPAAPRTALASGRAASPGSYLSNSMVEYSDSEHLRRSPAPALNRTGDAPHLFTRTYYTRARGLQRTAS